MNGQECTVCIFTTPGRAAEYCDQFVCLCVCLSVCLFVREYISGIAGPISTNFFVQILCGRVARSSSGGVGTSYVLPVLWMTSRLAIMGRMANSGAATPGRSMMSVNALWLYCKAH